MWSYTCSIENRNDTVSRYESIVTVTPVTDRRGDTLSFSAKRVAPPTMHIALSSAFIFGSK